MMTHKPKYTLEITDRKAALSRNISWRLRRAGTSEEITRVSDGLRAKGIPHRVLKTESVVTVISETP